MARQPKLITDTNDQWKIRGSFPNGRYQFSLRTGAVGLLTSDLGYGENDVLPWRLFRILVFTGDAWLPRHDGDQVKIGNDLAWPDKTTDLPKNDARALADHITSRRFGDTVRDALAAEIESTSLNRFLDPTDIPQKEEWVEDMAQLVESGTTSASSPASTSSEPESTPEKETSVRLLHIGRVTLGRQNMGRSERTHDYLQAFREAIDIAIERDVTAVLQTGGLFQSRSPEETTIADCRWELERLHNQDIPFYLVYARQEAEAKSDHLTQLADDDLLEPIGGQSITFSDDVVLHGIDAGETADVRRQSRACESGRDAFVVYAVGDADARTPQGQPFDTIASTVTTIPNVYLTGRRTDPAWGKQDGVPVVDPGATENVLSKTTFEERPVSRGVYEYTLGDGSFSAERHDLSVRPFETFRFDLDRNAGIAAIKKRVVDLDLSGKAVLGLLEGDKTEDSVTREAVQQFLAERSHCAKVYDERSIAEQSETSATSDPCERFDGLSVTDAGASYLGLLEDLEAVSLEDLSEDELVDLYALCSKVGSVTENIRKSTRDLLVERIMEGETAAGAFGSVEAHRRESRSLKPESDVLEAVERAGIPQEAVLTPQLDHQKIEELLEESHRSIQEDDVYERSVSNYVTRQGIDTEALGLADVTSSDS